MSKTDYQVLHAHLLDLLGAKDHEDAARIIGEHHAREMREREVGGAVTADEVWEACQVYEEAAINMPEEKAIRAVLENFAERRAAVPDGWKLVPAELIGETVQVLRNVDTQIRATGQPSARIERAINALYPLAAAPEVAA